MKGTFSILFGTFFLVGISSARAQVRLETGSTDAWKSNSVFQDTTRHTRPHRASGKVPFESAFIWYSCSDSLARIYRKPGETEVVILPEGDNCFGFRVSPGALSAHPVLVLDADFSSALSMDSISLKLAFSDGLGTATGFLPQVFHLYRSGIRPVQELDLSRFLAPSGRKLSRPLVHLSFQVVPVPEPFWGSLHFRKVILK